MRKVVFALVLALVGPVIASGVGEQELRLQLNRNGALTQFQWDHRQKAFPAHPNLPAAPIVYRLQTSRSFQRWETVLEMPGDREPQNGPFKVSLLNPELSSYAFFRIEQLINLPDTDLQGRELAGARLMGSNLQGTRLDRAVLRNATLARANLHEASLTAADLTGANLSNADLAYADFLGANLTKADLSGTIRLNTRMPDGHYDTDDVDAEYLTMEHSRDLLPPPALYAKIRDDLVCCPVSDLHYHPDREFSAHAQSCTVSPAY